MTSSTLFLRTGIAGLLLTSALAFAQGSPDGPPPTGNRRGPPPEAIAACVGKTVGSVVSFTGRQGNTVTGTCQQMGEMVAARPERAPPGAPPPAAK